MKKEIVYTDQYALILSDEALKKGDYRVNIQRRTIHFIDEEPSYFNKRNDVFKKVAFHLPLSDAPILEGVPLLPPLPQGDDVDVLGNEFYPLNDDLYPNSSLIRKAFIKGYNKAKEKYKYTEEDVLKVWNAAYIDALAIDEIDYKPLFFDNFIKSLQQPSRPTHFECEVEYDYRYNDDGERIGFPVHPTNTIKTTTNSQGQIELVGKYI